MRPARLALYFFVGLLLGGVTVFSYAETQPASYGAITSPIQYATQYDATGVCHASAGAACAARNMDVVGGGDYPACGKNNSPSFDTGPCCPAGTWKVTTGGKYSCSSGSGYSCPKDGGWTLNGQTCTRPDCAAGQTRNPATGQCSRSCTAPETLQADGTCRSMCGEIYVTPSGSCVRAIPCTSGDSASLATLAKAQPICAGQKPPEGCPPGGIQIGTFEGRPMCISPPPNDPGCTAIGGKVVGTLNGQPVCSNPSGNPGCPDGSASQGSLNGQPVCSDGCPSGSAKGTVNGVSSCYPVGPTTTQTTTQTANGQGSTTTTTTTTPGGGTTTTTSGGSSSTVCDGDRCTTTTTTTDGAGGTSTTTTENDKGDFCKQHPKSSVCTGESDQDQYCKDNPEAVSCLKTGTPGEEGGLNSVEKGVSSITPVSIASSNGCPADVQLPKGAVFSYAGPCMFAEGMRPVILASAWLIAGLIVLGMSRNG